MTAVLQTTTIRRPATAFTAVQRPTLVALPAVEAAPRTRLRLTRRGRVVLTSLAVIPAVLAAVLLGTLVPSVAGNADAVSQQVDYATLYAGQTLWSIAETIAPSEDPREVVDKILRMNGFTTVDIPVGTRLAVPSYDS